MKTKNASFTIKPFKNRNGAISYRVAGWLLGERIRKNFKKREDAILERSTLQLKQAQAGSNQASLKTQNNRRALLFTFFKYSCAQGWLVKNPLEGTTRHRVDHSRGSAAPALTAAQAGQLMAHVETIHGGAFVPFFALCLFAGIRPDGEITKLPADDVRLENNAITIEPWVSKVGMRRLVSIQPNLAAWLQVYPLDKYPIIPSREKIKNIAGKLSCIRRQFDLSHDVLRHTFISMHVAKFRSMGDAALQAGNSETIIRRHYLNVTTPQEADAFFSIVPALRAAPEARIATVASAVRRCLARSIGFRAAPRGDAQTAQTSRRVDRATRAWKPCHTSHSLHATTLPPPP